MNDSRLLLSLGRFSFAAFAGVLVFACADEPTSSPEAVPGEGDVPPDDGNTTSGNPTDPAETGDEKNDAGKGSTKDAGKSTKDAGKSEPPCTSKRWYVDADKDGFGLASTFLDTCPQPAGYVADSTDCDDTTSAVKPGAAEVCDAIDSNCDTNVNGTSAEAAGCTATVGSYGGTFSIYTAEKVGATIINQVTCTGTVTETIDLARKVVVQGTTTCSYPGSLVAFAKTQTSKIEGAVGLDGAFKGKLTHTFGSGMTATFTIDGTAKNGKIDVSSKGSWLPNAMSAVPWETTITLSSTKK